MPNPVQLLRCLTALVLSGGLSIASAHDPEVRYLGNAGVMVSAGEEKVVFDALFDADYGQYLLVAPETRAALIANRPPFEEIAAAFVSHVHGDHFSSAPTLAFLGAHPEVRLFAPRQVVDALRKDAGDASLLDRVVGFDLQPGDQPATLRAGSLGITAVAMPHAGGERHAAIQNLFFAVDLSGGPGILHLGDAAPDPAAFEGQRAFFEGRRFDLVLPPYWFFADGTGRALLDQFFAGAKTLGVHVPARAAEDPGGWRQALKADLFIEPAEIRMLGTTP